MDHPGLTEALRKISADQKDVIPIKIHPKYAFQARLIETSAVSETQDTDSTIAVWLYLIGNASSHIRLFMTEMPHSLRIDNRIVWSLGKFLTDKPLRCLDMIIGNQGTRIVSPATFEQAVSLVGDMLNPVPSGSTQQDTQLGPWPQERWLTIERAAYWFGTYDRIDDFRGTYCFRGSSRTRQLVEDFDRRFSQFPR